MPASFVLGSTISRAWSRRYSERRAAGMRWPSGRSTWPDPRSLDRYRSAVADDERGKELLELLEALTKKGSFVKSYDSYKRMPKGYDADHPRAEHLLRKGLTVEFPELPNGVLATPQFVPWLVSHAKLVAPLVEWLTFATH